MNKKNKSKRTSTTLDRKAHLRLKIISVRSRKTLEELIDEAAFLYLKAQANPDMIRGNGE